METSTREVAVLGDATIMTMDASTREVTVLVDVGFAATSDVSTRELAILTDALFQGLSDDVSRELSVLTGQAETSGEASSREVSVLTRVLTPTLLTMMTVNALLDGVEVRWEFGALSAIRSTVLERSDTAEGAFENLSVTISEESGVFTAVDRTVGDARTYWYRLVVGTRDDETAIFGPMSVTVGTRVTDLALAIAPNPTYGRVGVRFAVPHEMDVRISVFDVLGREVAILADQRHHAGEYSGTWDLSTKRGRAAAGVYFIRLQTKEKSLTRRLVIAN